jgi:hypothetical protein
LPHETLSFRPRLDDNWSGIAQQCSLLQAKEATFSQIQEMLAQHGVIVSESSITRFCRKHRAETQRLRLQLEQKFDLPSESPSIPATAPTAPPLMQSGKMRDLRGPV